MVKAGFNCLCNSKYCGYFWASPTFFVKWFFFCRVFMQCEEEEESILCATNVWTAWDYGKGRKEERKKQRGLSL